MISKSKKGKRKKKRDTSAFIPPLILLIIMAVVWESISRGFKIPITVLPPLSIIIRDTIQNFVVNIWPHALVTIRTIVFGLICGVPLGIILASIFSQFKATEYAVTPLALLLVLTPMITLVPIYMLVMGFDYEPRFIVVIVQSVPIILLNTLTGFGMRQEKFTKLMRGYGATKMQTFFKLIFPNALPQVFAGIKLGGVFSTIATMSVEMVAGNPGLGYRITYFSSQVQTPLVFGTIFIVAIIGIMIYSIIDFVERRVITWSS